MIDALYAFDPAEPPEVVFFPVRHYSPVSARLLHELARDLKPAAILVEGPSDFNERIHELRLDHVLPIAIYTYVRLSDDTKRRAFYPFCEYAPEWQAVALAGELDVPVEFIDLPWTDMARVSEREHRYSDTHFRENPYPKALCEKLDVADFDELWDVLFELEPTLDWQDYLERCHHFCYHLRIFGGEESTENRAREEFMVERIRRACAAHEGGPVLVVTGGYHSSGLYARLHDLELEYEPFDDLAVGALEAEEVDEDEELTPDDDPETQGEPPEIIESGITLTPFTYERIDKLSGYLSGVHGPAFYQYVWECRQRGERLDCAPFLYEIVSKLRNKGQLASTADVISIQSTARALANLRGRHEIWRFDLLDAISSALVKEAQDFEYAHPMLEVAREALRGVRRGFVDERAELPPLVRNARRELNAHDLLPEAQDRRLHFDLEDPEGRAKSRLLHRCRMLELEGFTYEGGTDFVARDDLAEIRETWSIAWSPEFEGGLIENAVYGSDLMEAATARVLERAAGIERDGKKAALLALEAVRMGLTSVAEELRERLTEIIRSDSDFFSIAEALGHLLYLYRYDEVLGTRADASLGELLGETYLRTLWLFEGLGKVKDRDHELLSAIRTLFETFRSCHPDLIDDREEFVAIFRRTAEDVDQAPMTRGASMGVLYTLGELDTDRVLTVMQSFLDPMDVGDFLVGFFSLAREAAQRDPRLIRLLDSMISTMSEEKFLEILPGLRLAFTFFTPLEKHNLIDALFTDKRSDLAGNVDLEPADVARGESLDARIRETLVRFGLRPALTREEREETSRELRDDPSTLSSDMEPALDEGQALRGEESAAPDDAAALPNDEGDGANGPQTLPGEQAGAPGDSGPAGDGSGSGTSSPVDEDERKERWRLVLGAGSEDRLGALSAAGAQREKLVSFLYDREYGPGRNIRGGDRRAGLGDSQITVPDWINGVHELFPKRTIERLEKDALERYDLEEIVTRPDVLRRAQPNPTLLKAVLRTKHLMNKEVLEIARRLVRQVVDELMEKLARDIRQPFTGAVDRRRRSFLKVAKNFDARETIRRNLKHYDPQRGQIVIQDPVFYSRIRRHVDRWQIIIVVDQSGSMLDSVIHAAVTASIFFGLDTIKTHLVAFDTNIVDLTSDCRDPVETLMGVQLGGGTDIANALTYVSGLVENPSRTIVVLITDFFEGGPLEHLLAATKALTESGVHLLGLAALDDQANPVYDRETAQKMVDLGAHVAAMTPGELARWVAEKVR